MINITRRALGVLVIKPAKGGAQLTVHAAGVPAQVKVRLDIARQGAAGPVGPVGPMGPAGAPVSINFSFGDAARVIVPALVGKIVLAVNINVATAFNGVGAFLSIGTLAVPDLLVAPTQLDLFVSTEFEINPNVKFNTPTDIYLTIAPGAGATQGAGWIVVEAAIFN